MAQEVHPHSDMVQARHNDGVNVIFDQKSPASSRSKSRSRSASSRRSSSSSGCSSASRGRRGKRDDCRSSSSSRSTSRSSRSRSHPRCHRPLSRCRCRDHHRRRARCISRSPTRHCRTHSRSPSVHRRRHDRSQSRSRNSYSRVGRYRSQFSRSPLRSFRNCSRSKSSERSLTLSLEEKQQLLEAARQNAMKSLGVQRLELPDSMKPILMSQTDHDAQGAERRVRQDSGNSTSQISEMPHDFIPRLSPKRGMISFSVKNSIAKPTVSTQSCVKVTSLVDSIESKKPYGHWVRVRSVRH